MRIKLNDLDVLLNTSNLPYRRNITSTERKQIDRILNVYRDSCRYLGTRISEVTFDPNLSERDIFILLSSFCPEVIEFGLQILCFQGELSLNSESDTSILLGILASEPRLLPILLEYKGWRQMPDVSQTLEKIRVQKIYRPRIEQVQRKRGYTDHGSMAPLETKIRKSCLTDELLEEYQRRVKYDRVLKDTIDFLVGYYS